jgi:SP family general alpha glucoside:H+ symporter-like MFS transporter
MDKARKVLESKYSKVPGYDIEAELGIIEATWRSQDEWNALAKAQGPFAIFHGLNLKRFFIGCYPKVSP